MVRRGGWSRALRLAGFVLFALAVLAGCANKKRGLYGIGGNNLPGGDLPDACAIPKAGCPCDEEGESVECGSVASETDGVVTCMKGTRSCEKGKWGECSNTHLEEQSVSHAVLQERPLTLGGQADCPTGASYDCDPYCNYQNDVPDNTIDAGPGFTTDGGLTLKATGTGASSCTSIAISVRSPTTTPDYIVRGFNPLSSSQTNNQVNLQVTATPSTCITAPFATTWTIDKFDRATISGTTSATGVLQLVNGIAGPIKVTAYAVGLSATLTVNVRVNAVEVPGSESTPSATLTDWRVNRKVAATSDMDLFGTNCHPTPSTGSLPTATTCADTPLVGTTASTASYLYPYPATWFPLSLVAPVVQYTYSSSANNNKAVKLSLRYPKNKTLTDIKTAATAASVYFNYSLIVKETNNFAQYAPTVLAAGQPLDPQVQIPQSAWKAFEQTVRSYGDAGDAAGYDADIRVQRLVGTTLEQEYVWPTAIHFAGGQLKGTVYYNSYNSTAGGSTSTNVIGAVLKINPGDAASAPTSAVPGSNGKCTICHSVSADGSTLTFASGDGNGSGCNGAVYQSAGSSYRENMCSFNMPAASLRKTYTSDSVDPYKFLWGAPYPDGSFYLNNVWDNSRILNSNYPSGSGVAAAAGLYRTTDGALLASSGTPASPVTPAFASDGTLLAFNNGSKNASGFAINVSELAACSVPTGPKVSEVESCGQPNGLTVSEVSSCPSVAVSEVAACGSTAGVKIAEVSSCPGLVISEIEPSGGASGGYTISEISPCKAAFTSATNGESIEIRNDGASTLAVSPATPLTIRAGTTTCTGGTSCGNLVPTTGTTYTLTPGSSVVYSTTNTTSCLGDASTNNNVAICQGTTLLATATYALGASCTSAAPRRAVQDCNGAWTNSATITDDATNDHCAEAVELRNDTPTSLDISNYKIRNVLNANCITVPAGTTLTPGNVWRGYVQTGLGVAGCFVDAADTVSVYDAAATPALRAQRSYAGMTGTAPRRATLSCTGVFLTNTAGGGNDPGNDVCSNVEAVEIRNDGAPFTIAAGWTIKNGTCAAGTTCATTAAATLVNGTPITYTTNAGMQNCLADGSGTVSLCNGATTVATYTYAHSCDLTAQHSHLNCGGAWSANPGYAFDTTDNLCGSTEAVEIRNDTSASVAIGGWSVRNGGGTACATVPASTTLAAGAAYRMNTTNNACLSDTSETVYLYTAATGGTLVNSHTYNATCGTGAKRSVLSCAGAWTDNVAITDLTAQNDTSNEACTGRQPEGIDFRNDTPNSFAIGAGWVVKNGTCAGGTQCGSALTAQSLAAGATLHVNTNTSAGLGCLSDGTGTVSICNGTTTLASYAYSHTCGGAATSAEQRSVLDCTGTWSAVNGLTFDTTNDSCAASQAFEAVEIRNDTNASININSWTVKPGTDCSATACATLSATAGSLSSGASIRVYSTANSGVCLTDATGSVTICNASNQPQVTKTYNHASCGRRAVLACSGSWTESAAGGTNDTTNDACGGSQTFEWVELRNDTAAPVDIGGYKVLVGGMTCATAPSPTVLAIGGVTQLYTGGACLPDTGATVQVVDGNGTPVSSQIYTSTCSASTPKRGYLPCPGSGSWANDQSSGTASSGNNNCSFTGSYNTSGKELHVMSFNAATKTFSGDVKVVDCNDAAQTGHDACTRPAYPAFLPDKSGVLYQHVVDDSNFESPVNSASGALAQIWITKTGSKSPRALDNLNGWNGSNAVTVPTSPRSTLLSATEQKPTGATTSILYDPTWHNGAGTSWIGDQWGGCFATLNSVAAREDRVNYFPTVSPQEAGGAYWAIFTSRRMYGNIAISNPWQVQRSNNTTNRFGLFTGSCNTNALNALSPGSGFVETKKLWVSAIDKNWNGTSDPSHPPFYLPGQELEAGNSHGYWVAAACSDLDATCETNDDCCYGTGTTPTRQCLTSVTAGVVSKTCKDKSDCSEAGEACTTSADCCGGLTCPTGGGLCLNVGGSLYEKQTYTREYVASCPVGTRVKWQNFEWQGVFPANTEIQFSVQTKAKAADTYLPMTATLLKKANTTTTAGMWDSKNVDGVLANATPPQPSLNYLLVTMEFRPNSGGTSAPALTNWRQIYDCLPNE